MARTSTYLNFTDKTEEAFNYYKSIFGGEFHGPIHRFSEASPEKGKPPLQEKDKNLIMHIELPILGGHMLMGTDAPESMGFKVLTGNNVYIMLEPDTKTEADNLFNALSADGKIEMPLQDMFWEAYYGSLTDKYGVHWMIHVNTKKTAM